MKKNLKVFSLSWLFFTMVSFVFLYLLLTRNGEPVDVADAFCLFLLAILYGVVFAGLYFCLARKEVVGGYFSDMLSWLLSWNRKQGGVLSLNKARRKEPLFPRYYLKIAKEQYEMRDASSAVHYVGVTKIAVDSDGSIVAVGDPEALNNIQRLIQEHTVFGRIISWFDEEKKMMTDAGAGNAAIRYGIAKLSRQFFIALSPDIIFHIVHKDSYSPSEINLIHDLGIKAGAKDIYIWNGGELSDYEIFSGEIFDDGWVGKRPSWIKEFLRKPEG